METPRTETPDPVALADQSVGREARRTVLALLVERFLAGFWPLWALGAAFFGLVFLGIPSLLPAPAHMALLAAFGAGAVFLLLRGILRFRKPGRAEALARLDEGVKGRPAQSYSDRLVTGAADAGTGAIWAAHQRRLAERAAALRAKAPDWRISGRDPFALRHGGALMLAAGLIGYFGADGGPGARLSDQFDPGAVISGVPKAAPTVEAWATPPDYTGAPAIYLTRLTDGAEITLPVGAEISLRVFDVPELPVLEEDTSGSAVAFQDKGAGVYDASFILTASGSIRILDEGREMATWRLTALPDAPPTIAFDAAPSEGERGALMLEYSASDDYGVTAAQLHIRLDEAAADERLGLTGEIRRFDPVAFDLPLPLSGDAREVQEAFTKDLAVSPWAGLPVIYRLRAEDAAGQVAEAEYRADLPARRFHDHMAKALVEQRATLIFTANTWPRAYDVLEAITLWPETIFDDMRAYLATRTAIHRLRNALEAGNEMAEADLILDLLWNAALRIEDGDLATAAERLARAQEQLRDAIENGAPDEEIARLMQELREAMQQYLAEMARDALRNQANGQQQQQQQGEQQSLSMDDIERMLRELEEALKNGDMETARQMMQALQSMMQNLQMANPGQGSSGPGEQMMEQLGDMIGEQQGLADRSFGQMQRGEGRRPGEGQGQGEGTHRNQGQGEGQGGSRPGEGGADSSDQIARDQEGLRQLLDQLRSGLPGSIGEDARRALEDADRAMGDAMKNLQQGDDRAAVDDQVRALEALREGRRQAGQDLANEAQQGDESNQAGREGRGGNASTEDPLGRPRASNGPNSGDSVNVPGAAPGKRARELQEEIRRRSGERTRPPEELDYLDRLLDRF